MKVTRKAPEETRNMLLDAAMKVFSSKGYSAAKLEDIAHEAGLTRGAITWHFKNKRTICETLLTERLNKEFDDIVALYQRNNPPLQVIESVIDYLIDDQEKRHMEVAIYNNLLIEKPSGLEGTIDFVENSFEELFKEHAATIQNGIKRNELRADVDPDFAARAFFNFFWGFFTNSKRFFNAFADEQLKSFIKNHFLHSLRK